MDGTEIRTEAIFLHSAFRSGSTWFWNRFREAAGTHAYYEPFHEIMGQMTPDIITEHRTDVWKSGHPPLAIPYFTEYRNLLPPDGGVPFYQGRFAYESYYLSADDAEQQRYIESLADHAHRLGKVPVFGFCRSLGRVPWFKRACRGTHIVTWRDPWDQWASIAEQTTRGNPYFDFRLYLIASIGRHCSEYHAFFEGLPVPRPIGANIYKKAVYLNAFFRATSTETRFRIFLRVYLLDLLLALPEADLIVDMDRLSSEADHREAVALQLQAMTGLAELWFDDCTLPRHPPQADASHYRTSLEEALSLLADVAPRHPRAAPMLQARLQAALDRFPPPSAEPAKPEPFNRLFLHMVKTAVDIVQRNERHTGEALDFLRETFGADFVGLQPQLAEIARFMSWNNPQERPAEQEAAECLHHALKPPSSHEAAA